MDKLDRLKEILKSYKAIAIAYSGGCDSNFLLSVAIDTLGKDRVLAVNCMGRMMSDEDQDDVYQYLKDTWHVIKPVNVFDVEQFRTNDKRRCYFCKKNVMNQVIDEAKKHGICYVADGRNVDDGNEYRPGLQACKELGICSPLYEAGMTKEDIRYYSKQLHIPTYNKPSNSCLASRFDYGTILTKEKLDCVNKGENLFHQLGIKHMRLRVQDELARIEVEKQDFDVVLKHPELIDELKKLGFRFVTLDLEGIKSGSYDQK